ncbi:MAG: type II toxin-antitoxin system PrlF family antitoxin [Actinobacteria bacterium]|jgi:antitoxin PrlF|nr:type II toxin-antitoxin system PrlF family antitoxin [Actinomycetota bacterium]
MSTQAVSKLTSKYQTTVPAAVREALCLEKGDALAFEIADSGAVTVRKAVALDQAFAASLQSQLSEWASDEDDEAYRGL